MEATESVVEVCGKTKNGIKKIPQTEGNRIKRGIENEGCSIASSKEFANVKAPRAE